MITLSELICNARNIYPVADIYSGNCIFCGKFTNFGHVAKMKESFTNAPLLSGEGVICPHCCHMQTAEIPDTKQSKGKLYRSNMWVASLDGIAVLRFPRKPNSKTTPRDLSKVFTLGEMTPRDALTNPPEPPFAIYLTRSWKKSGWQSMIRLNGGVSTSRDTFLVGFDYDPTYINSDQLRSDLSMIDQLRTSISKSEIANGQIKSSGTKRLIDAGFDVPNVISYLRSRSNDPTWTIAVYIA